MTRYRDTNTISLVHERRSTTTSVPNDRVASLVARRQLVDGKKPVQPFDGVQASNVNFTAGLSQCAHAAIKERGAEELWHR